MPPGASLAGRQDQQSSSDIKFIQIDQQEKPKPHSDFMLNQEALNILESEQKNRYYKMVRVMRQTDEDQNNEMPQLRNNNSQPYFLEDEDGSQIEEKVPHNVIQDYLPIYQLNNDQNKMAPNTLNQSANKTKGQNVGTGLDQSDSAANGAFNISQFQL